MEGRVAVTRRIVERLCRRPALLGWPIGAQFTIQRDFPLLSGQVVDIAVWNAQTYWLVRVLPHDVTDTDFERAVFECVTFKAAFDAELQKPAADVLVLPVLFVAREVQKPLLDWAFDLGVWVRGIELEAGLDG